MGSMNRNQKLIQPMYDAFEGECFNSMVFHADFPKVSGQFSVGRSTKAKVAA
jgi:hypothetical protein